MMNCRIAIWFVAIAIATGGCGNAASNNASNKVNVNATNINATNISVASPNANTKTPLPSRSPTPKGWQQQADEGNKAMQDIIDAVNK